MIVCFGRLCPFYYISKYPAAKPGALVREPLKTAKGVANAAPGLTGHLWWPTSTPQIRLIESPVFCFFDDGCTLLSSTRPTVETK